MPEPIPTPMIPRYLTVDASPLIGPIEARVFSNTSQQWFDFSSMTFVDQPKQIKALLEPNPKNIYQRRTPFITFLPGSYLLYAFTFGTDGKPVEYPEITSIEIPSQEPDRPILNISITQSARP